MGKEPNEKSEVSNKTSAESNTTLELIENKDDEGKLSKEKKNIPEDQLTTETNVTEDSTDTVINDENKQIQANAIVDDAVLIVSDDDTEDVAMNKDTKVNDENKVDSQENVEEGEKEGSGISKLFKVINDKIQKLQ